MTFRAKWFGSGGLGLRGRSEAWAFEVQRKATFVTKLLQCYHRSDPPLKPGLAPLPVALPKTHETALRGWYLPAGLAGVTAAAAGAGGDLVATTGWAPPAAGGSEEVVFVLETTTLWVNAAASGAPVLTVEVKDIEAAAFVTDGLGGLSAGGFPKLFSFFMYFNKLVY